nr:hypothetical protein Iba_chr13bCG13310 [Ipomoea batatas]
MIYHISTSVESVLSRLRNHLQIVKNEDTEMISTTPSFEVGELEIEEISSTSSDLETARQDEIEEISNTFDIEIFPDGLVPASQDEVGHLPIAVNPESLTESTDPLCDKSS